MKAIILASGPGKRLSPMTHETPKPLIKIDGEISILERILLSLKNSNIKNVIITTGPFEEKIKQLVESKFANLNVVYVNNLNYEKTNYIYSLWLTKDLINKENVILVHGDLVYDFKLMDRIINEDGSCVLVKQGRHLLQKDFKARIRNGLITEIGVNVFGKDARNCMPLYKIENNDYHLWMNEIDKFIKAGKTLCYAEDAFNKRSDEIKIHPIYYSTELCSEIDTFEDLERVKKKLKFSK